MNLSSDASQQPKPPSMGKQHFNTNNVKIISDQRHFKCKEKEVLIVHIWVQIENERPVHAKNSVRKQTL